MRSVLFLMIIVFLAGCAGRWEHPTKRPSEFYQDDRACQSLARGATEAIEPGSERPSYESCMWERGWRKKTSIWFFDGAGK